MTDHYRTYIFYGFAVPVAEFTKNGKGFGSYVSMRTAHHAFVMAPQSLNLLPSTHQLITEAEILQHSVAFADLIKQNYITEEYMNDLPQSEVSKIAQIGYVFEKKPEYRIAEFTMTFSGHLTLNRWLPITDGPPI
jgi:hypothetical protein